MGKEGKQVNVAMNGPSIEHDELIDFCEARNREDRNRASSAGESRQKIGEFLDETGMNGKALGWSRQILKIADKGGDGQAKAMDVILSMEKALPMIKSHVGGQSPELPGLEEPDPVGAVESAELPAPSYDDDPDFEELLANSTLAS